MIDDHELRLRRRLWIRLDLPGIRFLLVGVFKALAGLRLPLYRHRSDDTRSAGNRREFLKPPLAEHRSTADLVTLLRYSADDLVAERLHQTAQLFDISGMRDVVDPRGLDADKDRTRDGWFGFHDAALAGSFLCLAHAYHVFAMARAAKPLVYPREDDGRLRGFADRVHFAPPRRNGTAAFIDGC